jgi:hypothetical protein
MKTSINIKFFDRFGADTICFCEISKFLMIKYKRISKNVSENYPHLKARTIEHHCDYTQDSNSFHFKGYLKFSSFS